MEKTHRPQASSFSASGLQPSCDRICIHHNPTVFTFFHYVCLPFSQTERCCVNSSLLGVATPNNLGPPQTTFVVFDKIMPAIWTNNVHPVNWRPFFLLSPASQQAVSCQNKSQKQSKDTGSNPLPFDQTRPICTTRYPELLLFSYLKYLDKLCPRPARQNSNSLPYSHKYSNPPLSALLRERSQLRWEVVFEN